MLSHAGRTLPSNVVAIPDIVDAASQADILIFVIPHQFLEKSLSPLKGKLKPSAEGISLIKGFMIVPGKYFADQNSNFSGILMLPLITRSVNPTQLIVL